MSYFKTILLFFIISSLSIGNSFAQEEKVQKESKNKVILYQKKIDKTTYEYSFIVKPFVTEKYVEQRKSRYLATYSDLKAMSFNHSTQTVKIIINKSHSSELLEKVIRSFRFQEYEILLVK